ncbi:MAG TPA: desulfoferrodoxin family protein [Eubacteriales bacterium]|jgi:superoxide reductase|nr:desulfoferrodoxin family protein [Clostridia bacterium]HRR90619.1 desulfoferrodoxin family protein [Eubacteriales bacterium]HRU84994.1 desulfoferrodoxin family protein [Eubacteriales bacterium]
MEKKFYICQYCGNIIGMINDSGIPVVCCGEDMQLLEPNTVDASYEKHIPVVEIAGGLVTVLVGSAPHPMLPEHYIDWVYLETEQGGQRKNCKGEPKAVFALTPDDKVIAAYAYCNLHGLWKKAL